MKLTVERDELSRALGIVSRAVAGKTPLPILTCVLMAAAGDELTLTATDLTTSLRTRIPANVTASCAIALEAKILIEWLGGVAAKATVTVDIDPAKHRATFRADGARMTLAGLDPEDYPVVPSINAQPAVSVPATMLRGMIDRTVIMTETDEHSRPVLHGILVRLTTDRISMAGADGFRMAHDVADLPNGPSEEITAVVPRSSAITLASLIDDDTGTVALALAGPQRTILAARLGDIEWGSRLIEGQYPNVEQLIRREHSASISVSRASLRAAIRGSRSLSAANKDVTVLSIEDEGMTLRIAAMDADRGDADTVLPVHLLSGSTEKVPDKIGMNWKFLNDVLAVLDQDDVHLHVIEGTLLPVNITDPELPGYVGILMPMSIGGR